MRVTRVSSALTLGAAILSAVLLIAASLDPGALRSSAAQPIHARTQAKARKAQPPTDLPGPLSEQRLVGGFWRLDHTFEPTLIITNILQSLPLPVTPILYAADGTEFDLPVVTLSPAGVSSIDIRSALAVAPGEIKAHFSDYGSVAVKYTWHWSGAASALVENRNAKRSLNFGFDLHTPMAPMPQMAHAKDSKAPMHATGVIVQQGLWWREDPGVTGYLALINTGSHSVNVQVQVLSDRGAFESEKNVHLQPNETANLDLLEGIQGASGGVQVAYNGAEKDVIVAGGLENSREGYSAQIPFLTAASADANPANVSVSSVGLMLGTPDPMMKFPAATRFGVYLAMRNTSTQPILVKPTLYYMQGPDVAKVPLQTIALGARQAKHWSPEDLSAELGLPHFSGMINLVFSYQGDPHDVVMASGSIDQTRNYVFEIKMKGVGKSQGMELKDWDVSNGNDTMISLLNLDEKDQDFWVTLFFDGGLYKLPVHLKAGGSSMFNVSEVVVMQQPDADGKTIPAGALRGSARLSAASLDAQWINVGVSVGIFNVSTATCGQRCPTCSNYSELEVLPFNSSSYLAPIGGTATFQSWAFAQDGLWHNVTSLSSWSSDNSSVASSQGNGGYSGVSPGTFNAWASASLPYGPGDCVENNTPCPTGPLGPAAAGGLIQEPTSIGVSIGNKITHNGDSAGICPGPTCISVCYGYERRLTYTVLDQSTPPQPIQNATMTANENVTKVSSNPANAGGNVNVTVAVGSNGTFGDILALCFSAPPPPQPGEFIKDKQVLTITYNNQGYQIRTNCLDFESGDVTLTDVTSNPSATCQ